MMTLAPLTIRLVEYAVRFIIAASILATLNYIIKIPSFSCLDIYNYGG